MPSAADPPRVAVVLAGGESRRFGSDKLAADLGGTPLLERTLAGLPDNLDVIVVGPPRPLRRAVRFVREDPPGGGPAAAMITGLRAALSAGAGIVWVLPGDAPAAGSAAGELHGALARHDSVVAVDSDDRIQPLQLVLRRAAADQLVRAAGPDGGRDESARRLVLALDPPAHRRRIEARGHADIDTADQLEAWRADHLRNDDHA